MVVSAKEEKEKKLEILRTLFTEPLEAISSVYKLSKIVNIPQPTVKRYIPKLKKEGLITVKKEEKRRKSIKPIITQKGILYLIFYKELTDKELENALNKYFGMLNAPKTIYQLGYETYRHVFETIKSRINFDYYDQQYVDETFDELITFESLKLKTKKGFEPNNTDVVNGLVRQDREGIKALLKKYKRYEEKYKFQYEAMKQINQGIQYSLKVRR